MPSSLEIFANLFYLAAVLLAARNSVHTWSIGLIGCVLFAWLFFHVQLYADVTLQGFFIVTSLVGWWSWLHGRKGAPMPIGRTDWHGLALALLVAVLVALGYGALLQHFSDAYAPFIDSLVLTLSVLAQLLLMRRKLERLAERRYRHLFLCADDFPFVQDGTRRDERFRRRQNRWYEEELARRGWAYTRLSGSPAQRLGQMLRRHAARAWPSATT